MSLRVVRKPVSLSEHALGVAFLEGRGGRYADIFFDHVERLRGKEAGVNLDTIFGYAMAHEIGHLLLGSNSHSRSGIMQGEWRGDQLRSIGLGELLFTSDQGERMREQVVSRARENRPHPILAGVRE